MDKYPDFWSVIIGPGPVGAFLGFIVVAYVSAMVSLLLEASNRDIASTNTPVKFSWRFLWAANWKRIFANFLAVPLLIRISYQYVGIEMMILAAIGIGAIIDQAAMKLKKIGVLSSQKTADKIHQKINDQN